MNFKELYERLIQTASSTVDNNIDTVSQEISDKIAGTYNIFNVPYDGMNDFSSGYAKGGQECYFINFHVNKSAVNDFIFDLLCDQLKNLIYFLIFSFYKIKISIFI